MTAVELAGVVDGLDEAAYHAHPALSASGAKRLLHCPAAFQWERQHGRPPKREFDLGHAVHAALLGVGMDVVIVQKTTKDKTRVDADNYQTVSAQQHRDEIRAEGKVPLLRSELEQVASMAAAVRANRDALAVLDRPGKAEQSIFWHDWTYGIDRRARCDWLPEPDSDGRLVIGDLKTAADASPEGFAKAAFNYGYDVQATYYTDAAQAVGLAQDVVFRLIVVEKDPPHLTAVYELDALALRIGRRRTDKALATFAECTSSGVWPGYPAGVQLIGAPPWIARQWDEAGPWEPDPAF